MWFPTIDVVIDANDFVIQEFPHRKADRHDLLDRLKLIRLLQEIDLSNDSYSVAARILAAIVQSHCFASANKRTGLFIAREFLLKNGYDVAIENSKENARTLIGIRERFYTLKHIQHWLRTGEIHEFKR